MERERESDGERVTGTDLADGDQSVPHQCRPWTGLFPKEKASLPTQMDPPETIKDTSYHTPKIQMHFLDHVSPFCFFLDYN